MYSPYAVVIVASVLPCFNLPKRHSCRLDGVRTGYSRRSKDEKDSPCRKRTGFQVSDFGGAHRRERRLRPAVSAGGVDLGDGTPFANKVVTFDVTRSNGRLTEDGVGEGDMMLQVRTDINGEAPAFWMLGSDAGCGNNRVEVASTSIVGTTAFCASATAAPATQINIGSGNNQRAEADGPAPEPLSVWVSDSRNQAGGVSVTFTVVEGGGKVDGADFSDVLTDQTGHAEVNFTLGPDPGVNIVEATFGTNPGLPATFTVTGVVRDVSQPTSFSGLVLDNANRPIQGADHLRDRPLGFSLDATRFFGSDGGSITRKNLAVPPSHGWCCAEALEDRRSDGDRTGVAGSGARTGGLALAHTMEWVV